MVPPNQSYVGSSNDLNTAYKECRLRDPPSQCALELSLEKLKKRGRLVCIKNSERLLYRKSTLHDHGLYKKSSFGFLWQERLAGSSIRVGETDRTLSISKVGDNQKKGEGGRKVIGTRGNITALHTLISTVSPRAQLARTHTLNAVRPVDRDDRLTQNLRAMP